MRKVVLFFKEKYYIFLPMLLIAIICLYHITDLYGPVVVPDEMGYWAVGAELAGKDWSGIMSSASYYAFGYGLFLTPLFFLNNPVLAFRVAILLNVIFLECIYLLGIKISSLLFPYLSKKNYALLALLLCLYPFNLFYVQTTNAELPMTFLFILLLYLVISYLQKKRIIQLFLSTLLACILFAFHLRNIGILFAFSFTIVFFFFFHKIKLNHIIFFALETVILVIFIFIAKEYFIDNIYSLSDIVSKNDFSGQTSKIWSLFSVSGIINMIVNVLGRLFYLGCSTFFLIYYGIYTIIKNIYYSFKSKIYNIFFFVNLFVLMVFISEVGISALSMIDPYRIDNVLYGRYSEHVIWPILLMGLNFLIKNKIKIKSFFYLASMHGIVSIILYVYYTLKKLTEPSGYSIVSLIGWDFPYSWSEAYKYSIGIAIVSIVLSVILITFCEKKLKLIVFCVGCFWIFSSSLASDKLLYNEIELKQGYFELIPSLQQLGDCQDIYYVVDSDDAGTSVYWHIYKFQFFVPDSRIHLISVEDVDELPEHSIVLVHHSSKTLIEIRDKYIPNLTESVFNVFVIE